MKRIILTSVVAIFGFLAVKAQEIPERKTEQFHPKERHKDHMKNEMRSLNLTEDQKTQFKTQHEEFRKQMDELKKNDNITVKEWRSKMETLRKDQQNKMNSILTPEQKDKLEKAKKEQRGMHEIDSKARMDKMKLRLGLSDEQAEKMSKAHKEMGEKMKTIREDKTMDADKKKEAMKSLMKEQKEKTKSILTEEQMKKLKETKKEHTHAHKAQTI